MAQHKINISFTIYGDEDYIIDKNAELQHMRNSWNMPVTEAYKRIFETGMTAEKAKEKSEAEDILASKAAAITEYEHTRKAITFRRMQKAAFLVGKEKFDEDQLEMGTTPDFLYEFWEWYEIENKDSYASDVRMYLAGIFTNGQELTPEEVKAMAIEDGIVEDDKDWTNFSVYANRFEYTKYGARGVWKKPPG